MTAARYRLSALVEVHNRRELDVAIEAGADLIGVNNRNLSAFEATLDTSLSLAGLMPARALLVSESGIHNAATSSGSAPPATTPSSSANTS